MRTRLRGLFPRLAAFLVMTAACWAVFDVSLRLFSAHFPMPLQNLILGRYGFGPGDIYYQVPPSPLHRLKPDFRASMFYNGYRWEHRTNALGIRDDDFFTRADLVLLGDSMVYGHGLDFRDTLSENLERRSGLRAANLGVQGDYPPFELARLEETGLALKPKAVLFFTELDQDMEDMILRRPSDKDVQALLSAPVLENPQARRLEPPPALAWRSWPSVKVFRFMARRALRGLKQESSGPQPSADLDMDSRAFEVFFRVIEKARDLC
ncbi:MAG TPA: hypothetical protein VL688_09560, partial [Verrucomicrobiae bacterium]|nr:hypothetical protein [Verrucomicrobiae bacterium]